MDTDLHSKRPVLLGVSAEKIMQYVYQAMKMTDYDTVNEYLD